MSWSANLWDQTDALAAHTQRGLDALEKFSSFLKERAAIEYDYAKQISGLARRYQQKKMDGYESELTSISTLNANFRELQCLANQHERLCDDLKDLAVAKVYAAHKDLKEQRKLCLAEISRLQQNFDASIDHLHKSKKDYNRAFKEAECAQLKFDRADADRNLSRADVDKAKNAAIHKAQLCEDAKNSYALQLRKTNEARQLHFSSLLPAALDKLREIDERRTDCLKNFALEGVVAEQNVLPIVDTCLKTMLANCQNIDARADSLAVVKNFQTGYDPPPDFVFVELGNEIAGGSQDGFLRVQSSNNGLATALSPGRKERKASLGRAHSARKAMIPRIFARKADSTSSRDDFSDLPPAQRCNKLTNKISEVEKQLDLIESQKDGLVKMRHVYSENPNLGNLSQVNDEIDRCNAEQATLRAELDKLKTSLEYVTSAFDKKLMCNNRHSKQTNLTACSSAGSDGSSLHRSNSDISDDVASERSPEALHASEDNNGESEYYQSADRVDGVAESAVPSGIARVIYDFSGDNEGTIAISADEELTLLEKDAGDGWTKVRRSGDGAEGFVPTAYLECKWLC